MNATGFLMQIPLSLFNFLCSIFLAHLGVMYCCPQNAYMGLHLSIKYRWPQVHPLLIFSLLASCFSVLGPSEVNDLFHPWVIACFSGPSSYLYMSDRFTFPNPHTGLFLLNLVEGQPQVLDNTTLTHYKAEARYIPFQVLIVFPFYT